MLLERVAGLTCHDGDLAGEIRRLFKGELLGLRHESMGTGDAHVLGNCLLDCFHGFHGQ